MTFRTARRLHWLAMSALVALVISVPTLAVAGSGSPVAKKKVKKKPSNVGPRGPRGARGLQGFSGTPGKEGAVGASGPSGAKGDKGDTGDQKTKVFNVAMAPGEADRVVLHYPPFDIKARCQDNGAGSVTAKFVATTSTDDSYLATTTSGAQVPNFDVGSGERPLALDVAITVPGAPAATSLSGFTLAAPAGAAVGGQVSIGSNAYGSPGGTPSVCLFTGTVTTT